MLEAVSSFESGGVPPVWSWASQRALVTSSLWTRAGVQESSGAADAAMDEHQFFIGRILLQAGAWGLFVGVFLVGVISSLPTKGSKSAAGRTRRATGARGPSEAARRNLSSDHRMKDVTH